MKPPASSRGVIVTGGTRGIGRAVAELFQERGDRVAVCGRSGEPRDLPGGIWAARADVRSRAEVGEFIRQAQEHLGSLQILVNCAGVSRWRPLGQVDEAFAGEVFQTCVLGTLWASAAAADRLEAGGVIVNVSSLAGKRGSANNSVYCAAKFAVNGLTQALAKELGPRGIRVNAVCPVYVETDGILASLAEPHSPAAGRPVQTYLAEFARTQTALERLPTAREVAEAVYFLSSAAASAITGQCLNVDCGTLPQ